MKQFIAMIEERGKERRARLAETTERCGPCEMDLPGDNWRPHFATPEHKARWQRIYKAGGDWFETDNRKGRES